MDAMQTLLLAALFLPRPAFADSKPLELDINPGYSMPMGVTSKAMTGSGTLNLAAGWKLSSRWAVGLSGGYFFGHTFDGTMSVHTTQAQDLEGVDYTSNIKDTIYELTPFVKFEQPFSLLGRKLRVSAAFGAGLYDVYTNAGNMYLSGINPTTGQNMAGQIYFMPESDNKYFGTNAGVGLDIALGGPFSLGAAVTYHRIYNHDFDAFFVPTSSLVFAF
jgi:outer membrane protein with beta-barrel domain